AACSPAALNKKGQPSYAAAVALIVLLGGTAAWGAWRLAVSPETPTSVRVRVVQPNVEQSHKWDASRREEGFEQLLAMTGTPAENPPAAIVWPETASVFYLEEDPAHRRAIAARLSPGAVVLTGVIRRSLGEDGRLHYANSLVAVDRTGRIAM